MDELQGATKKLVLKEMEEISTTKVKLNVVQQMNEEHLMEQEVE